LLKTDESDSSLLVDAKRASFNKKTVRILRSHVAAFSLLHVSVHLQVTQYKTNLH